MKKTLNILLWCLAGQTSFAQQHPLTFFTKAEAASVKSSIPKYPLLTESYDEIKTDVDQYIGKDIDVPFPKDPAGGYTHDRHKANYMIMFNAGILYNTTGDERYAKIVKEMLFKYAKLNPQLKNHPQATSSSPGHIFWQALNDANWLVYTGMAYDLIYNSMTPAERKTIEDGAFKPEVDFLTVDLKDWFNLIHNHGVWACAGVGIVGIATNNKDYIDMALYGTDKKGKSGFIAQMDGLFSPDGYYTEGAYYVRYAILPYYLFANALQHARPELGVFQHRNSILKKALLAGLEQTNLNGTFFPINDALKEKDYTSNELVSAVDIAWGVYGKDNGLLTVAKKQDRVLINKGGASIAAVIAATKNISEYYPYATAEYTDGMKGDEGGVSLLRTGKDKKLSTLIFKYASHGLSHGHFDELNINFFDKGNEIFTDYGSVRFIGVEQKYGGRYLPENKTYASATIAHNTMVVDEKTQFDGNEDIAEKYHSEKLFSDVKRPGVQVVAAKEDNAYKGVQLQRNVYMLQLPDGKKLIADIFKATSAEEHQYDLPFQYSGNLISTSFKYTANTKEQKQLGSKNGYQFLWKEAQASVKDTLAQFTFLNDRTYYTISSLIGGDADLFFTRTGANDPNFNLRREPAYIIRRKGSNQSFINVLEVHGNFDPVIEFSSDSYSVVKEMKLLQNDTDFTVVKIIIGGKALIVAQANKDFTNTAHTAGGISWNGPYTVLLEGKKL
jgi:hypothetical protein